MSDAEQVERVARAMVVPLGYPADVDWERTWVGNNIDSPETGSLAYLCRSLARAAIAAIEPTGEDVLQEPRDAAQDNVVLEARVRFTAHFPEPYDNLDHIKFRYNEGTWCADNLIDDMKAFATKQGCACDMVERVNVISINGAPVNEPDPGIPIHPTALAEKGIPGLATREVEGE
jgi:hypothetical protein